MHVFIKPKHPIHTNKEEINVIPQLPKPKVPLIYFSKVHKMNNQAEFTFKNDLDYQKYQGSSA